MDGMTVYRAAVAMPVQASSDAQLIALWLHGLSDAARQAYARDLRDFLDGQPLRAMTLGDLHRFADSLADLAPASRKREIVAVKLAISFAHRVGYGAYNLGVAMRLPTVKNVLAERILTEADVHRLLAFEPDPRNAALLGLTYAAGLRVTEAAQVRWRDLQPCDDAGQMTVLGKGSKTRVVLLPASTWRAIAELRGEAGPDNAVFASTRSGGPLDRTAMHRIVKAAAKRAGLSAAVSAHWLRHAHVSHALDRGAPAHLVQASVGHSSLATASRYARARPGDSSARYLGP